MKEYDAYLFDADGTLMDTRELIMHSFLHMGGVMGAEISREIVHNTIGMPVITQMHLLLGGDRPEAEYLRAREVYDDFMLKHLDDYLRSFPGAIETVAELQRRGKKLAVVTSRRLGSTTAFLERLGLKHFFTHFITPECTEKHKPNPEPALLAMEKLGAKPETTVFIGDAIFDIKCGSAAGTDTAFVLWGGIDPATLEVRPDWIVSSFDQLLPDKE